MSSNTTRNGGSGKPSGHGAGRGDTTLPIRWVVLFTGSTATDDYQPFASAGEPDSLIREVAKMCVDFHPHSEIRLFPKDRETYLFWRAKATTDWVITRVSTAPNPEGLRVALEYASIVLSDSTFALLRYNPFRLRPLNLHDRVRQQFLSGKYEPLDYALAPEVLPGGMPSNGSAAEGNAESRPQISADSLSTPENFQALQQFCSRPVDPPAPPPTFATWWSSGGPVPEGCFEIVLRAAPPRAASLREVVQGGTALVAELKEAIPSVPASDNVAGELTRSILDNANQVASGVAGAADRINSDTPDQFRENLASASRQSGQIATDLATLTKRLGAALPMPERERLLSLSERYENLGQELPKVRHPNPFSNNLAASRPATPVATVDRISDRPASGGLKPQLIAIPVVIIAGIALAAWKLAPATKPAADTTTPTVASASPSPAGAVAERSAPSPAPAGEGNAPTPASDPTLAPLQKGQASVLALARQKAHDTARTAAAKGVTLSAGNIDKITVNAIKGAYKETLDASTYTAAFGAKSGRAWNYTKFAQNLPALAPAVHEGATVGATEGAADSKVKIAEAEAVSARLAAEAARNKPTPEPVATPRASRKHSDNGDTAKATTPKEKPAEKPREKPKEKPTTPKAGSADKTGL